jgi:hypothetical protein
MKTNTIFIISRSFLLRMRNVSNNSWKENQNTNLVLYFPLNYFLKISLAADTSCNLTFPDISRFSSFVGTMYERSPLHKHTEIQPNPRHE